MRLGVSHKRFSGWEPREVTEHHYRKGRLVQTITTREVEWDEEQRALALAMFQFQAETCHGCGGWLQETTAEEAEGKYVALPPIRCHRCKVINAEREAYHEEPELYHPDSYVIWLASDKRKEVPGD